MISTFFTLIFSLTTQAQSPVCLNGFYDLGERSAALGFVCKNGEPQGRAMIFFCKREILLGEGYCTGSKQTVQCGWKSDSWICEEKGTYPFLAEIRKLAENKISYKFKSSFNEGELVGTRIP